MKFDSKDGLLTTVRITFCRASKLIRKKKGIYSKRFWGIFSFVIGRVHVALNQNQLNILGKTTTKRATTIVVVSDDGSID